MFTVGDDVGDGSGCHDGEGHEPSHREHAFHLDLANRWRRHHLDKFRKIRSTATKSFRKLRHKSVNYGTNPYNTDGTAEFHS